MNKHPQRKQIEELIHETTASHLADCLDLVPDENIEAISDMIDHCRSQKVQRSVIRFQIIQDVAAIVEGKPENAMYSKPFLN